MDHQSGKSWIVKAFGVFLIGLVFWFILAIWTGTTFALDLHFAQDLRSNLTADYGDGPSDQSMKYLSLSILGEVFSDQGITDGSMELLDEILNDPVPTATKAGDPAEIAQLPSVTPSQTPDLTSTAIASETENSISVMSMTETPTPTPSETATGTPTSTPTSTSTATATKTNIPLKTPTPTWEPSETPFIGNVYPILECVEYYGEGRWKAFFGYKNPSTETQYIPVGDWNRFYPEPENRGQPTSFSPGRSNEYPDAAFSVEFEESTKLIWYLTAYSVEASMYSNYCDSVIVPTPTYTSVPQDTEPPEVLWGYLDPIPGNLTGCSETIHIEHLQVTDPPYSSGIDWVKLKYVVHNYTSEIYSNPLTLVDGGATAEGGWNGYYSGSITVTIDPEWVIPTDDFFYVEFYGKAKDNVSKYGLMYLGTYSIPGSCGTAPE